MNVNYTAWFEKYVRLHSQVPYAFAFAVSSMQGESTGTPTASANTPARRSVERKRSNTMYGQQVQMPAADLAACWTLVMPACKQAATICCLPHLHTDTSITTCSLHVTHLASIACCACLGHPVPDIKLTKGTQLGRCLFLLQATWQGGWDVVTPSDVEISTSLSQLLHAQPGSKDSFGNRSGLQRGQVLQQKDQACRQFYVLLTVSCYTWSGPNIIRYQHTNQNATHMTACMAYSIRIIGNDLQQLTFLPLFSCLTCLAAG